MERLRVLSAAAALNEFTISELAAYSGANENTLRSVLRRDGRMFQVLPEGARRFSTGRPTKRYQVVNVGRIREEISALELEVKTFTAEATLQGRSVRDLQDDRLAAIVLAEDAVLRAWDSDSADEKQLLSRTARENLSQSQNEAPEPTDSRDDLTRRAASVSVFAELVDLEASGEPLTPRRLAIGAAALADLADVAPQDSVGRFLDLLSNAAIRGNELPPMGFITEANEAPAKSMPELEQVDWIQWQHPEAGRVFWAQRWSEVLLDQHLILGILVQDSGDEASTLEDVLAQVSEWHVPKLVISSAWSDKALIRVATAGALSLPLSAGLKDVADALVNAADITGVLRSHQRDARPALAVEMAIAVESPRVLAKHSGE